ncbi:hypothetical protein BRD56_01765 [Thermoplasmatales archaeon SW_10_69_26]|nr:MAG: hypothetical protein BRD56_01765 [Thermoplasmatales archaeon SW_10_69_26]
MFARDNLVRYENAWSGEPGWADTRHAVDQQIPIEPGDSGGRETRPPQVSLPSSSSHFMNSNGVEQASQRYWALATTVPKADTSSVSSLPQCGHSGCSGRWPSLRAGTGPGTHATASMPRWLDPSAPVPWSSACEPSGIGRGALLRCSGVRLSARSARQRCTFFPGQGFAACVPEALRDLGEILPALGFASVGALGAGALLGAMTPHLRAAPGVLVIVPGLMALRGNINGAMGARLGSAVHLGLLEPEDPFGPVARANVLASLCLSLAVGAAVGGLGWLLSVIAGLPAISLVRLTLIGAVTGLLSGLALAVVTLAIVVTATLRGIDPDNVTGPLLTVVGDVITMGILFVVLGVLG